MAEINFLLRARIPKEKRTLIHESIRISRHTLNARIKSENEFLRSCNITLQITNSCRVAS
eukprot:15715912-Heterocapsa_arctica.AAC.1